MRFLFLFGSLFSFSGAFAQTTQTVTFTSLGSKGTLYIGWYASEADFRKPEKAVIQQKVTVSGQETHAVTFSNVKPGTYAIAVFLDKNNNGKIDTNVLGIPKEEYGFSNNVFPMTRAASFKEAAIKVDKSDLKLSIKLK